MLVAEIDVYWLIKSPKSQGDVDFVATTEDVATLESIGTR